MGHSNFSKILLGLDGSSYAEAAIEYACQIALNHNATITGVAIIDEPGIQSSSGPVPIGGTHYDVKLEDQLLEETQAEAKAILDNFARICDERKINAILHTDIGSPVSELIEESKFHDFIVIGKQTSFEYDTNETYGTLERVLKNGLIPVLAVSDSVREIKNVLVAYDNSIPASKVVHMFLLLGIWGACDITLLTVNNDAAAAQELLGNLGGFFESYGIKPTLATRSGHPDTVVKSYIAENDIDMLVMGAYGRRSVREFFVGSVTYHLIHETEIPLFLYH
ncbi:MAG: universal stress protein [Candidatus Poribacteria bacterium]|nr:universal stress protein [Candidatus Poribacteria bacterium]